MIDIESKISTVTLTFQWSQHLYSLDANDAASLDKFVANKNRHGRGTLLLFPIYLVLRVVFIAFDGVIWFLFEM